MSRICQMCPGNIDRFIDRVRRTNKTLCADAYARLDEIVRNMRMRRERFANSVGQEIERTKAIVETALKMWKEKYHAIESMAVPSEIEKKNEKGETVRVHNPLYDRRLACLEQMRPLGKQLEAQLDDCNKKEEELRRGLKHIEEFLRQVLDMRAILDEICTSTERHCEELAAQARGARVSLSNAMVEEDPLPAMRRNDGVVSIDGVQTYAREIRGAVAQCRLRLDELRRTSAGLPPEWDDAVYRHFDDLVQDEITARFHAAAERVEDVAAALEAMCAELEDYYDTEIEIHRSERHVSYCTVDLEHGRTLGISSIYMYI